MIAPTFRVSLPCSVNSLWKCPHKHSQRHVIVGKMVLCPFFSPFWFCFFFSAIELYDFFYLLDIKFLPNTQFANIFCFMGGLFTLRMASWLGKSLVFYLLVSLFIYFEVFKKIVSLIFLLRLLYNCKTSPYPSLPPSKSSHTPLTCFQIHSFFFLLTIVTCICGHTHASMSLYSYLYVCVLSGLKYPGIG